MEGLRVHRLVNHLHLRGGAGLLQATTQVLRDALDHHVDEALLRAGVPVDAPVCVRQVAVRVRLRPGAAAARAWSDAFARAVRRALDEDAPGNVIRYRSRREALVDFVAGMAAGRGERSWAWRRLGLDAGGPPAEAVTRALLAAPEAAAAVLAAVAGGPEGAALVNLLAPAHWVRLAEVVGETAGTPPWLLLTAASSAAARAPSHLATRIVRNSRLVQTVAAAAPGRLGETPLRRAFALLACAEIEPGRLAAGREAAAALVHEVCLRLPGDPARRSAETGVPPVETAPPAGGPSPASPPIVPLADGPAWPAAAARPARRSPAEQAAVDASPSAPVALAVSEPAAIADQVHAEPASGLTAHAGLFFLLHVLDELELPAWLCEDSRLAGRSLRSILRALAAHLAPVADDDPARLGFAGLPLDAAPDDEPALVEAEQAAISEAAQRVRARVAELLPGWLDEGGDAVDRLVRRRGRVVAYPGWFDVELALDEVVLEVRSAGLDLDPGFVPWLGAVVRFIYG